MKLKLTHALILATLMSNSALVRADAANTDSTLSFNVGAVSDYRYRGISQSRLKSAAQGGIDWTHPIGFYLGSWASTIKWIKDAGGSAAAEVDLYGGYKGSLDALSYDVGVLRYQYPDHNLDISPNTTEIYGAATFGPATLKYSHAVTNLFGFDNSKNSYYLDATATVDLSNGWSIAPHVGRQKVKNFSAASYTDYSLTLGKDFGNSWSASAALVGSNASHALYLTPAGKFTGKTGLVVGLKYSF